jgi:hypothetical protein
MEFKIFRSDQWYVQEENVVRANPYTRKAILIGNWSIDVLANQTRPNILFAVSLLARHSAQPTITHWNGIKRISKYLQGAIDIGLYFPKDMSNVLTAFVDARYLSNPDDAKSQTGYLFLHGSMTILWKSSNQTLITTLSNHAKVIAL